MGGVSDDHIGAGDLLHHALAGLGLLAQVDCAGLAGLPDFPTTGLLQFFVSPGDVWGLNFDDPTDTAGFRVLYHEEVDRTVTPEEVESKRPPRPEGADDWLPLCKNCRIVLSPPAEQGMNETDPRFGPLFAEKWNALRPDAPVTGTWDMHQLVPERLRDYDATYQPGWEAAFHQLGGYPYFTQDDPRPGQYEDFDTLLFQLDSCDLVLWGDYGVGNFFINRDALKRRDFSKVLYNWDCC